MRLRAAFVLAALLVATYSDTCAPWDGAALAIDVETLGLKVRLYNESIAKFEAGGSVLAEKAPAPEGNIAEVWGRSGRVPYERVSVEAKMDPKTHKGVISVDGVKHRVRFKKTGDAPPRCG